MFYRQASRSKVADVISLNYLVEGREVNELHGNETISLKFDRKEQSIQPQVSYIPKGVLYRRIFQV